MQDIFTEILGSDQIGAWTGYGALSWVGGLLNDPSWCWEQLLTNPYLAHAIFDDYCEKDSMVSSCIDTRRDGVLAKPRVVLPNGEMRQDKKLGAWVEETLTDYFNPLASDDGVHFGFENFLYEALEAVGRGLAVGEILWQNSADRIAVRDVRFKPPTLFGFGDGGLAVYTLASYAYPQNGPLRLREGVFVSNTPTDGKLPQHKFFTHTYRPRYSNRWGSPLLRRVFWPSWFKRNSVKQWLKYLEKGTGTVLARYNDGAAQDEQTRALESAEAIAEESAVAVPKKFLIDVLESVRTMGSSHREMVDEFCNNEIARAILGQTLTSRGSEGGGGSRALGSVHNEVRQEKVEADAKSLMLAVNTQIVFPLLFLNYGPTVRKPPVWTIQCEPAAEQAVMADWLTKLYQMSFPLSRNWIYNAFQIPAPESDEDKLVAPAMAQDTPANSPTDQKTDFAEKKTLPDGHDDWNNTSLEQQNSKKERFGRLRPSMMRFSSES